MSHVAFCFRGQSPERHLLLKLTKKIKRLPFDKMRHFWMIFKHCVDSCWHFYRHFIVVARFVYNLHCLRGAYFFFLRSSHWSWIFFSRCVFLQTIVISSSLVISSFFFASFSIIVVHSFSALLVVLSREFVWFSFQ